MKLGGIGGGYTVELMPIQEQRHTNSMPHWRSLRNAGDPCPSEELPYDEGMPDTYGKRQRENVKANKAAAKEQRRIARNQRREAQAAGLLPPEEEEVAGEPNSENGEGERETL